MNVEKFYEKEDYEYINFQTGQYGRKITIYSKDVDNEIEMYISNDENDITLYFTQENIKDLIEFLTRQIITT